MSSATRVRVELRRKYNDPNKNFREMFSEFKRQVSNAGILHDYKDHEVFESKSEKKRKKKKEAVKKQRQEDISKRVLAGERVNAPPGLIRKIISNSKKNNKRGSYGEK